MKSSVAIDFFFGFSCRFINFSLDLPLSLSLSLSWTSITGETAAGR